MRTLEMPVGTYTQTKERVAALAWATNRRGRAPWKGVNVTRTIWQYLQEHGYTEVAPPEVMRAMRKIQETGFGYIKYDEGEHRVLEFGFFPDVDLTGFSLPKRSNGTQKKVEEVSPAEIVKEEVIVSSGAPKTFIPPPIPAAPKILPYRLIDLTSRLEAWFEADPENYSNWVDSAIESLDANT